MRLTAVKILTGTGVGVGVGVACAVTKLISERRMKAKIFILFGGLVVLQLIFKQVTNLHFFSWAKDLIFLS